MQKSTVSGEVPPFALPMPWWVSSGSQDDHVNSANNITPFEPQKSQHTRNQSSDKEKESVFQLAFSTGENNNTFKEDNMHNHQTNSFQHIPSSQNKGYIELGLGQPMVYANYPVADQHHGLFTAYGTQPVGRLMLPFSLSTEAIYVNPKQYHGILRRRKMRVKEGLNNKSSRDKPYLHESRHRHACRRLRGAGGRFLNTKVLDGQKNEQEPRKKTSDLLAYHSSESSGSEVLQSESVNLNSSNEFSNGKTSNLSNSEVSSMYYSKEFDCFSVNPARPFAFHPLSNMEGNRQGGCNWVTAATDGCCDFFKV